MKKILSMVLASTLMLANLAGCSSSGDNGSTNSSGTGSTNTNTNSGSGDIVKIVATTFPEYDWMRQIVGEDNDAVELTLLLKNGVDLHSYQPTVDDIITISSADLFVHVGGVSDSWVEGAVAEAVNENIVVLNEIAMLGAAVKMEESVEGMQASSHDHDHDEEEHDHDHDEEEHDHDHDEEEHDHDEEEHDHDHDEEEHDHDHDEEEHDHDEEEHDHDHDEEEHDHDHDEEEHDHDEDDHSGHNHEDEHVWLSLRNAQDICVLLTEALCDLMPEQADVFEENLDSYLQELSDLDEAYKEMVAESEKKTILVADRFPFRYLVDDYNLDYYAAFSGCSAETEASFETIAFLSEKVDELQLSHILTMENQSHNIATTVSDTSSFGPSVLVLDSMESTSLSDANSGTTYLSVMTSNLDILREALQ